MSIFDKHKKPTESMSLFGDDANQSGVNENSAPVAESPEVSEVVTQESLIEASAEEPLNDLTDLSGTELTVEAEQPELIQPIEQAETADEVLSALNFNGGDEPPTFDIHNVFDDDDGGETTDIGRFAEKAYLEYSMSVVLGRALPYCQDGQKPVQRRILYAMHEMGLVSSSKHVKSARVVGDVLGKYHPHGDVSVYEAAVRVSQRFTMRYPLIDGQGNFGSRDGDSAAAMRYTEMRLTPISELLLSELNKGTVDFRANYDGSFVEPVLMPARLPMLLMNGAEGIAVGMSAKIPPHNLGEVTEAAILAVRGKATFENVMEHIKGPDFPEGCQVISSHEEILSAYRNGSGTIRMRARWNVEQLARGQYRIVVTELPYGVGAKQVLLSMDSIANPQVKKNKKALDAGQIALKQTLLAMVDKVSDGSDKLPRIIIEPYSSKIDANELMNFLFANTPLEDTFSINMTMVGIDGKACRKNIVDVLNEWAQFRFEIVTKRTQFAMDKANARIHILDGRLIVYLSIERVIQVIRESEEPKQALMDSFGLTEIQAEDILEIRLRQLAKLEGFKIQAERDELAIEAARLLELLQNDGSMRNQIVKEMRDDMKKYNDDRRTLLEPVERIKVSVSTMVPDEPLTIILSKQGWIRSRQGHGLDLANINWRPGDSAQLILETRTVYPVIIFDNKGRVYSFQASLIPGGKGDGVPVSTLADLQNGGKISHMLSIPSDSNLLLSGANGYGFIAPLGKMLARNKAGKDFMTLDDKEVMLTPLLVSNETHVAMTTNSRLLVFPLNEVKTLANGGKGIQLMIPDDGLSVNTIRLYTEPLEIEVPGKGSKIKVIKDDDLIKYVGKRARKGAML